MLFTAIANRNFVFSDTSSHLIFVTTSLILTVTINWTKILSFLRDDFFYQGNVVQYRPLGIFIAVIKSQFTSNLHYDFLPLLSFLGCFSIEYSPSSKTVTVIVFSMRNDTQFHEKINRSEEILSGVFVESETLKTEELRNFISNGVQKRILAVKILNFAPQNLIDPVTLPDVDFPSELTFIFTFSKVRKNKQLIYGSNENDLNDTSSLFKGAYLTLRSLDDENKASHCEVNKKLKVLSTLRLPISPTRESDFSSGMENVIYFLKNWKNNEKTQEMSVVNQEGSFDQKSMQNLADSALKGSETQNKKIILPQNNDNIYNSLQNDVKSLNIIFKHESDICERFCRLRAMDEPEYGKERLCIDMLQQAFIYLQNCENKEHFLELIEINAGKKFEDRNLQFFVENQDLMICTLSIAVTNPRFLDSLTTSSLEGFLEQVGMFSELIQSGSPESTGSVYEGHSISGVKIENETL